MTLDVSVDSRKNHHLPVIVINCVSKAWRIDNSQSQLYSTFFQQHLISFHLTATNPLVDNQLTTIKHCHHIQ